MHNHFDKNLNVKGLIEQYKPEIAESKESNGAIAFLLPQKE